MKIFSLFQHQTREHALAGRLLILGGLLMCSAAMGLGCSKPVASDGNYTNSFVIVTTINNNERLESDILTNGYGIDDMVVVKFQSTLWVDEDDPTASRNSAMNSIQLHTYHVTHQRTDGGPNPSDFTSGMNLLIPPDSDAEASVVVVRAFDKHRSPLEELRDDGEIFTTSILTFYGEDGYGNDIAVSTSMSISYANFPDQ